MEGTTGNMGSGAKAANDRDCGWIWTPLAKAMNWGLDRTFSRHRTATASKGRRSRGRRRTARSGGLGRGHQQLDIVILVQALSELHAVRPSDEGGVGVQALLTRPLGEGEWGLVGMESVGKEPVGKEPVGKEPVGKEAMEHRDQDHGVASRALWFIQGSQVS